MTDRNLRIAQLFESSAEDVPEPLENAIRDLAHRFFDRDTKGLLPGARLGAYTITRELGRGARCTVYEAQHTQLGRMVALKVPWDDTGGKLVREARFAVQLEHPRISRIEDIVETGERPFLVMELCRGGSLAQVIKSNPGGLPVPLVLNIARNVLQALAHAHARGVVHRDIKPENILFDELGQAKLADFGFEVGTPLYLAPEQELRDHTLDGRTDFYGFGKVLSFMLTGREPRTLQPPSWVRPQLDPLWDRLVFGLVEDDLSRRFQSIDDVFKQLDQIGAVSGEAIDGALLRATSSRLRAFRFAMIVWTPLLLLFLVMTSLFYEELERLATMCAPVVLAGWASTKWLRWLESKKPRGGSLERFSATVGGLGSIFWVTFLTWLMTSYCALAGSSVGDFFFVFGMIALLSLVALLVGYIVTRALSRSAGEKRE